MIIYTCKWACIISFFLPLPLLPLLLFLPPLLPSPSVLPLPSPPPLPSVLSFPPTPIGVCSEGNVRFTSGSSYTSYVYNTRTDVLSGNLEICVNGQNRYLCGQSNVTGFNASDIVAAACHQLGYVSKFS